jgi:hypothetical protein
MWIPRLGRARALVLVSLLLAPGLQAARQQDAFPDPASFGRRVRDGIRLDEELQQHFSYVERRRDVRISKLGKVEVGPLRTFEVYPSSVPGRTYKRLIAVDGTPLTERELARRDQEHAAHLEKERASRERETPQARRERVEKEAEQRRERDAIVNDAFNVFQARFIGRESLDGETVLVVALTPREDVRVATREGRWMKQFEGRAWVSEDEFQVAKLEMQARGDVSIGWGILGRVHEGSRFVFKRRKFEEAWLPAEVIFDATGRTLLFRKFDIDLVTTYSQYKRIP